MQRAELINLLSAWMLEKRAAHPLRVGITGVDASGKTTIADECAKVIVSLGRQAIRASIDSFYTPGHLGRANKHSYTPETYYETAFDYKALGELFLSPLGQGGSRRVQRSSWDLIADQAVPRDIIEVSDDAIGIVDGVFLLHPRIRQYFDVIIWMEVKREVALTRALNRDAVWKYPQEEIHARYTSRNFPAHELYIRRTGGSSGADIVIDNTFPHDPQVLSHWPPQGM